MRYIPTNLNFEDMMTKALVPKKHKEGVELIINDKDAYRIVTTRHEMTDEKYEVSYFIIQQETLMVFIKRTRHTMQILVRESAWCVCSRAKEATVVPVIVIHNHKLREITQDLSVFDQQLDLVSVIRIHCDDASTRLTVGLEEATFSIIDDNVSNDGVLHVVQRWVEVLRTGLTCGVVWSRVCHRNVVKRKIDARIFIDGGSILGEN